MSWNDLDDNASPPLSPAVTPLSARMVWLAGEPANKPLFDMLRAAVEAPSYIFGRDPLDTAFNEGYRAFARMLLKQSVPPKE